jgi:hypothetical protein
VTRLRFGVVPEVVIACGILAACAFFASCLSGCGSTLQQHRALDTVAAAVDPSYALAVEACDEAEWVIVRREGTTAEADAAAIAHIRTTCNRVFGAFEALRIAHEVARSAVDGGGEAIKAAALARLHEAWAALRAIAPEIERL